MGNYSGVGRVTWAASSKDKVRFYVEKQFNGEFYNGFNTYAVSTPEAATDGFGGGWDPQHPVDPRAVQQAAARSRALLLQPAVLAGVPRGPERDRAAEPERLDRPGVGRAAAT